MSIHTLLAIVIAAWLISMVSSVAALILAILDPLGRFRLSLALAGAAMIIGYLGFGHWTPFRFFPQIGYTWSSGDFKVSLSSSSFFLASLVLGTAAMLLAIANRKRLRHS